jgi:hypothetical protein
MDDVMAFEDALDAALSMLHPIKARPVIKVIGVLRQELRRQGWTVAFLSEAEIAARGNLSASTVSTLLGSTPGRGALWRTMWVVERCCPAEGTRPIGLRLRHPVLWRGLHWTERNDLLRRTRLGDPTRLPYRQAEGDLLSQSISARQQQLAARSMNRAAERRVKNAQARLAARSLWARDNDIVDDAVSRAITTEDSRTAGGAGAPSTLAEDGPGPADAPGGVSDAPEVDAPSSALSEQQQPTATSVLKLVAAINRRGNGRVSAKSLKARLHRVAAAVAEDDLLDAVDLAPAHLQPPLVVALLEEIARGEVTVDELRPGAGDAKAAEAAALEARRASALRLAATCDELDDPDGAERHRAEAAECDNRLHQLSSTGEVA